MEVNESKPCTSCRWCVVPSALLGSNELIELAAYCENTAASVGVSAVLGVQSRSCFVRRMPDAPCGPAGNCFHQAINPRDRKWPR